MWHGIIDRQYLKKGLIIINQIHRHGKITGTMKNACNFYKASCYIKIDKTSWATSM